MPPRIKQAYTDTTTGASYPDSVLQIEDSSLPGLAGPLVVQLARYVNASAADSKQAPCARHRLLITGDAFTALRSSFESAVVEYILSLPVFEDGAVV